MLHPRRLAGIRIKETPSRSRVAQNRYQLLISSLSHRIRQSLIEKIVRQCSWAEEKLGGFLKNEKLSENAVRIFPNFFVNFIINFPSERFNPGESRKAPPERQKINITFQKNSLVCSITIKQRYNCCISLPFTLNFFKYYCKDFFARFLCRFSCL